MNAEYALSHEEDSDEILELIYTDEEGTTFVRDDGEWVEVDPSNDSPTVFDTPLVFVNDDIVPFYDANDDLTLGDTTQFHVV